MAKRMEDYQPGVSWADVNQMARWIERTTGRIVIIRLQPHRRNDDRPTWSVVVTLAKSVTEEWMIGGLKAVKDFPSPDHRTLPGLLFAMLYDLDDQARKLEAQAERQAKF